MAKIPDCDRCQFYTRSDYLMCPVHPYGVHGNTCLDFRPKASLEEEEELWTPEGYFWYGDDLIKLNSPRLTREQQLELLNTHPLLTGCCPQCGYLFDRNDPPPVHWDCPACGWIDDSIH